MPKTQNLVKDFGEYSTNSIFSTCLKSRDFIAIIFWYSFRGATQD